MNLTALLFAFAGTFLAVGIPLYYGRRKPGYSHLRHTISELAETGTPDKTVVSWLGFIPLGVFLLAFFATIKPSLPDHPDLLPTLAALSAVGISYIGGTLFPCDPDAPLWGTWTNQIHNLFGGVGYIGGIAGLFLLASIFDTVPGWTWSSFYLRLSGGVMAAAFLVLAVPGHRYRGLAQRIAEGVYFFWVAALAVTSFLSS